MVLPVRARRVYRDTALLIVRHPDGSLSHVPEWMTSPEAAVFSPRSLVVIPVRNLRDLRNTLDALSSFSSDSDDGGGRGNTTCRQSTKSVSTGGSAGSARASEALAHCCAACCWRSCSAQTREVLPRRAIMNKITPEHLSRGAIVYIRQSTPGQVANNLESKRRQYGLADRARQLGWQQVTLIDDDQGHSCTFPHAVPGR